MKHIFLIMTLIFLSSCGRHSESKVRNLEGGDKRPLKLFNEEDVARYAIAVLSNKPGQNFEVQKSKDEILVVERKSGEDSQQQYLVKIGAQGLILCKDNRGQWTDRFKDRRIFYYEQDDKLILSEVFDGDSTTYYEFTK